MTNDATNAIAAAPTTRSPNAGVGIGPLVATAALAGTCWDSTALSRLCGDLISYSFGRRQRNLVRGHSMRLCSRNQHRGPPRSTPWPTLALLWRYQTLSRETHSSAAIRALTEVRLSAASRRPLQSRWG